MLTRDVPQWVYQSFVRSLRSIGATASDEEIAMCYSELADCWCVPNRHHHDIRHLLDMLKRIDTLAPEMTNVDLVRIAAWFHGVVFSTSDLDVYTRNGGENEIASAKIAREYLERLGVDSTYHDQIAKLIIGLKKPPKIDVEPIIGAPKPDETSTLEMIDMDQIALRDAHLGALAAEPQKYRHYLEDIRQEYAHIPQAHFLLARSQIVTKLLMRKRLFHSPLAQQWEDPARENLEAELERLKAKLALLDGSSTSAASQAPVRVSIPELQQNIDVDQADRENIESGEYPDSDRSSDDSALAMADRPAKLEPQTSSLEKLDDMFSPGPAPKKNLTPEQAEREARKKIAEEAWQAIEAKTNK